MFDLGAIQGSLKEFGLDGWLFYDFRGATSWPGGFWGWIRNRSEAGGSSTTSLPAASRRSWCTGSRRPALDDLPGEKSIYLRWQELEAGVGRLLQGSRRVAMEYAPRVSNPYVSRVDAGTIELVRSCGVEVVSSGDLIQQFEATWDDDQWQMHLDAEKVTIAAYRRGIRADRRAGRGGRHGPRDRGPVGHHGPFPPPRTDHLQPADRRRGPAQRRPALRAGRRQGRGDRRG